MNAELEALIDRINVASKPARQLNGIVRAYSGSVLVKLHGDGEVSTSGDGFDWPRERQAYRHDVGPYSDALIIHALKLDAQQRNARLMTDWFLEDDRWTCGVSVMRNYGGGQSSASTMSLHEDEATAHCLAWLAAFEDTGE